MEVSVPALTIQSWILTRPFYETLRRKFICKIPFLDSSLSNARPFTEKNPSSAAWFTFLFPWLFTCSVFFHQRACRVWAAGAIFSQRWQVKSPASPTDWGSHGSNGRSFSSAGVLPTSIFFSFWHSWPPRYPCLLQRCVYLNHQSHIIPIYSTSIPPPFFCSSHHTSDSPSIAALIRHIF